MPNDCPFGNQQGNMKRKLMKVAVWILFYVKKNENSIRKNLPLFGEESDFFSLESLLFF